MINHYRTLLMNTSGSYEKDFPGEQYLPPSFRARRLPTHLQDVWRCFFGARPDRAMLNWRVQEMLTCVHACRLDAYLLDPDPRITYWPFNASLRDRRLLGPIGQQLSGADQEISFVFDPTVTSKTDRIYFSWRLTVVDANDYSIRYTDSDGSPQTQAGTYTLSGGLSSVVDLPEAPLGVRFNAVDPTQWELSWLSLPNRSMADALASAESIVADSFFDNQEPYRTFRSLWQEHDQATYRLAGLILALAYRIHELE